MPIFGIASLLASVASFASAVQLNLKSEFGGSSFFDGFYYNESLSSYLSLEDSELSHR